MNAADLAKFKQLIHTSTLPDIGPTSRPEAQPVGPLETQLNAFFQKGRLPNTTEKTLRSAALLWHDHLDESHTLSQDLRNADGSFLHGIMHRREPDYGNAKYWFHRVGQHPAFAELAERAGPVLQRSPAARSLSVRLIVGEQWDPFAFVDACEKGVALRADAPERLLLRQLQALEFEVLLEHLESGE